MDYQKISGFADEICRSFEDQLDAVRRMGMKYICIRSADVDGSGVRNIADFTPEEAKAWLFPLLSSRGIGVSSLGSPIGKIGIEDEPAFEKQLAQLENMCQVCHILGCSYIRIFSFYMPAGQDPALYADQVIGKMKKFVAIAERYDVILLHENEKDIYGDIGSRCAEIFKRIDSPYLRAAFDFANFVQCGEDTAECWELLKPYVVYIHIKDALYSNRENVLCGTGDGLILPILKDAFENLRYDGFLTLEPHLVIFSSLQTLEKGNPNDVILKNKFASGEEGYEAQYRALLDILAQIRNKEE